MKKSKSHIVIPLVFTVIPAVALSVLYVSRLTNEPYNYMISYPAMFIALASIISLIIILRYDIDYVKTYKRTLLTDIMLFLGVIPLTVIMLIIQNENVSSIMVFSYPIICIFVIANKVRLILKEDNETNKPKLLHILTITFINPLLPLLSLPLGIAYDIQLMSIHGLGIK